MLPAGEDITAHLVATRPAGRGGLAGDGALGDGAEDDGGIAAYLAPCPGGPGDGALGDGAEDDGGIAAYLAPCPGGPGGAARGAPRGHGGAATARRAYYGNAEPEGATAYVGGAERTTGGWAAYEVARRHARRAAAPRGACGPASSYPGRTYISGTDVLESLCACGPQREEPLARAAERLAAALEGLEAALCAPGASAWESLGADPRVAVTLPPLTAAEVRGAWPETDPHELHRLAAEAALFGSTAGATPPPRAPSPPAGLPPLPQRVVPVEDAPAVELLETEAVPRAEALAAYRGQVAACLDQAAVALEAGALAAAPRRLLKAGRGA